MPILSVPLKDRTPIRGINEAVLKRVCFSCQKTLKEAVQSGAVLNVPGDHHPAEAFFNLPEIPVSVEVDKAVTEIHRTTGGRFRDEAGCNVEISLLLRMFVIDGNDSCAAILCKAVLRIVKCRKGFPGPVWFHSLSLL